MDVVPFTAEHLPAAAALLAARQAHDLSRDHTLPGGLTNPSATLPILEESLKEAAGVAALDQGRLAGYLLATETPLQFAMRKATVLPAFHAAEEARTEDLYRAMYAEVAAAWVERGLFTHSVHVRRDDQAAIEAWFGLGFGLDLTFAARSASGSVSASSPGEIRPAGASDLAAIIDLSLGLGEYNAASPLFHPFIYDLALWRREMDELLTSPDAATFLACEHERPVGLMAVSSGANLAPMTLPESSSFIDIAYISPAARAAGLGSALLDRCLAWSRERGYRSCTVEYFTANIAGSRFWLSREFRPTIATLTRRLNAGIAWAKGPGALRT